MRHYALAALVFFAVPATSTVVASSAAAAGEDRALALDLFEQGRALFKKGDYAGALVKFEAAARVMRTFGILLNIAECQEKLGRPASAWATWREARALAAQAPKPDDEAIAAERQKGLESKLSRMTISVSREADVPGLEILRDGESVPRAAWGAAIAVDPGAHVVEERAPSRKTRKVDITVQPNGDRATLTVAALELEPAAEVAASSSTTTPSSSLTPLAPVGTGHDTATQDSRGGRRLAGWVLGGAGLVGVGAGIAVAVAGQGKHNEAVTTDLGGNLPLAEQMESSANTMKSAGYVTIGVGGALLATGVILVLTAPSSRPPSTFARLEPWFSSTAGGASLSGVW